MKQEEYPKALYATNFIQSGVVHPHLYIAEDLKDSSGVKYIRADLVSKWHKYPDEEPDECRDYLVTCTDGFVYIYDWDIKDRCFKEACIIMDDIIAWQELPEPYKEDFSPYLDKKKTTYTIAEIAKILNVDVNELRIEQ